MYSKEINNVWVCGAIPECLQVEKIVEKYFTIYKPNPPLNGIFDYEKVDMAIIVGGDGTILENVFKGPLYTFNIPVLKVHHRLNAKKSLGYTIDVSMENLEQALQDIKDGEYIINEKYLLSVSLIDEEGDECVEYALNDVGICSSAPNTNILAKINASSEWRDIEQNIHETNDDLPTPKCTGLVVSTNYGSGAWNQSLGGPLCVDEDIPVMLLSLRESPLKPEHYLFSMYHTLTITNKGNFGFDVTVDRRCYHNINGIIKIELLEDNKIKMIRTTNTYESLTKKLIRAHKYQYEQIN